MLIPALYLGAQRLTYLELTADDPRDVARKMVDGLAQKHRWSAADKEAALAAVNRADPPGLNAWASGPEWWAAIADELREDYRPALRPAVELADEGARGWQRLSGADQLRELAQGLRDDTDELVGAAGEVAGLGGDVVKAAGQTAAKVRKLGPGGLLAGLLLVGGALAAWKAR